jgi:hypothetical protein
MDWDDEGEDGTPEQQHQRRLQREADQAGLAAAGPPTSSPHAPTCPSAEDSHSTMRRVSCTEALEQGSAATPSAPPQTDAWTYAKAAAESARTAAVTAVHARMNLAAKLAATLDKAIATLAASPLPPSCAYALTLIRQYVITTADALAAGNLAHPSNFPTDDSLPQPGWRPSKTGVNAELRWQPAHRQPPTPTGRCWPCSKDKPALTDRSKAPLVCAAG